MSKYTKAVTLIIGTIGTIAALGANTSFAKEPIELARVNNHIITDQDLFAQLGSMTPSEKENFLKNPYSKRELLKRVITMNSLADKAKEKKLDQDPKFQARLKMLQIAALANEEEAKEVFPQLTKIEEKRYYDSHKDRYSNDRVGVQHILLNTDEEARRILKLVKDPNANFETLAQQFSKDPSVKNNAGNLGLITRTTLVPEFTEAAFSTPVGKVAGPVRTSFGYHVIKVTEKKPGSPLDFEDVELRVQSDLGQILGQNHVEQIAKTQKISINTKALDNLRP